MLKKFFRKRSKPELPPGLFAVAGAFCSASLELLIEGTFGTTKEQKLKVTHYLFGVFDAAGQASNTEELETLAAFTAYLINTVQLEITAQTLRDVLDSQNLPEFKRYRIAGGRSFLESIKTSRPEEHIFSLSHLLLEDSEHKQNADVSNAGVGNDDSQKDGPPGPWWENL
jgi:hypothetical protein